MDMNTKEITEICLKVLDIIKQDTRGFAGHPTHIAIEIDYALRRVGIESDIYGKVVKLPYMKQIDISHIMQELSFNTEVIKAVNETLMPRDGEIEAILNELRNGLNKIPKLATALTAVSAPLIIAAEYKHAMHRVEPFVIAGQMSPEAASDYANAITIGALESSVTSGLSDNIGNNIGNKMLSDWIQNHPEIPDQVLDKLDLGRVREFQDLLSGSEPAA